MIDRIRDALAPRRTTPVSERGYRRLLRWASLPATDRRWAAPLSAVALGFGLFAGVAIGPGAAGTLATAPLQVIEVPGFGGGADDGGSEGSPLATRPESSGGFGEGEPPSSFVPIAPEEEPLEPAGSEEPAKEPTPEKEPEQPEKQELAGTVVHVNPAAGSYTVAETGGVMSAVHAGKLPSPGTQIEVPIETLANGTLAEAGTRHKKGTKARATLAGIVTFVDSDPAAPAYTVSNKGASVLVEVHPDPAGAVPSLPVLGAYASVTVDIEALKPASTSAAGSEEGQAEPTPGGESPPPVQSLPEPAPPAPIPAAPAPPAPSCAPAPENQPPAPIAPASALWQGQLSGGGAPFTHADFEGIVEAVCPATAQLLVSADDIRKAGHNLLFTVPAGIDTGKLAIGDSILATADIARDGSLALTGLASDEHRKGADDASAAQGDLAPAKVKG